VTKPTEKDLDLALEGAFKGNAAFTEWFLDKTKFQGQLASYLWSRSDNPWGRFEFPELNLKTGTHEIVFKEGETDVLVVFQTLDEKRFALHIENKLASGHFTPSQPELYAARAAFWQGKPQYRSYQEWETVLVAPNAFFQRCKTEATKFHRFVSHEEIAAHIPLFSTRP